MINFPQNPAAGQVYTFGAKSWKWNGRAWDLQSISDAQVQRAETAATQAAASASDALGAANVLTKQSVSILRYLPPNYVADGSVDYTAYLQPAFDAAKAGNMVLEGAPGIFAVSGNGLMVSGPFTLHGPGMNQFWLKNPNGPVLRVKGVGLDVEGVSLWSQGGGHAVIQIGSLSQSTWQRHRIVQDNANYSCWDCAGYEYVDNRHTDFEFNHVLGSTVPGFNLTAAGGVINDNLFSDGRVSYSGIHFFRVRSTTANYQYANFFKRITFEVCRGGGIDLQGAMLFEIDGCQNWDADAGLITRHFYDIAINSSGIGSIGKIRNCGRWAGSNAAGIYDMRLPGAGGGAGIEIDNCSTSGGGDPFSIDCANNQVLVRVNNDSEMSLINGASALVLRPTGIQFPGSTKQLSAYDEGTWTPVIGSAGAFTYTNQSGKWTKIGRQVTAQGYLSLATVANAAGTVVITGLPFAVPNALANYGSLQITADGLAVGATGQITGFGNLSGTSIIVQQFSAGALADISAYLKAGTALRFSFTYFVS